jgi:hypothetical protein
METAGEELSRLRAENACLKQLLESKDAQLVCRDEHLACKDALLAAKEIVIATKDELLASRAAGPQRCGHAECRHSLEHALKFVVAESDAVAVVSGKRQRLHDTSVLPLDRDDLLDHIFTYVGGGDHLYTGGVSRRWRGRYMQHCVQNSTSRLDDSW